MLKSHCLEILVRCSGFYGCFINFEIKTCTNLHGPTIYLSVFDGMATLLREKLVASCVEPKVFGGTRIYGQLNPVNHQLHDVAPKVFTFNPKRTHFHNDKESVMAKVFMKSKTKSLYMFC